jgi:hypothetical protein
MGDWLLRSECRKVAAELLEHVESTTIFIGAVADGWCLDCQIAHWAFTTVTLETGGPKVVSHAFPCGETATLAREGLKRAMLKVRPACTIYDCGDGDNLFRRAAMAWPSDTLFNIILVIEAEQRASRQSP